MSTKTSWPRWWIIGVSLLLMTGAEGATALSPPPVAGLTVVSPNGGETYSLTDSLTITWQMSDSIDLLMSQLVFNLSLDSGITFNYMGDIRRSSPFWKARSIRFSLRDSLWDEQTITWKPIVPSSGCIIYINQYNSTTLYDQSDNSFRITAPARVDHFTPAARKITGKVQVGAAYDIQGRRIRMSGVRMQGTVVEAKGVFIEGGRLRLTAR
jgi:hypothetical protein